MKLNLVEYFEVIRNEAYVVIKPSNTLPDYRDGSDIDIFCYLPEKMAELTCSFLSSYLNTSSTIDVVDVEDRIHIDYLVNRKLIFRFDLYKKLPMYKSINLKSSFYESAIESSIEKTISNEKLTSIIKMPCPTDDFILRYVEYHEYFIARPDKVKHINYINNKISNENKEKALEKLHYYVSFNQPIYRAKTLGEKFTENWQYYQSQFEKARHLYKTSGIKQVLQKVLKK